MMCQLTGVQAVRQLYASDVDRVSICVHLWKIHHSIDFNK